jgi:lysyl-tRNA synthetase class 2
MSDTENKPLEESSEQVEVRRQKLAKLKEAGHSPYSNDFRPSHTTRDILADYGSLSDQELGGLTVEPYVAGRIMGIRKMGKAAFFHIQDRRGRIQVYARKDRLGDEVYALFQSLDIGDIVGVWGHLFRTKTKELTIEAEGLRLLSKCLRPLPEKWHGLADVEARYRQRYVDLMVNPEVRDLFEKRSRIVRLLRRFFEERIFGGGDADDAGNSGSGGASICYTPQRPEYRSVSARGAGAVLEAPVGGRIRKGI